jgi:hypothetical protein
LVNVFVEFVSLGDPSRRIFHDGAGMHEYLLCIVFYCGRLSLVACYFSSFSDIWGRRTGCDFLNLGDGLSLSPSLGTRGGLYRMRLPQQ